MPYVNNKGTNQPAHLRSPISTFLVHCLHSTILILAKFKISRVYLASVVEQASLCLIWSQTSEHSFSRDMARIM